METEQFSLCWNNFHNNLSSGFHSLLQDEDLVDVTLAAEGRYVKAHKTVLSVCSPYFKELFRVNPCKHPIVILQDVKYAALNSLLQFMYQGEVSVSQEEIPAFMKVAEMLKVKGLTEQNSADKNSIENNGFRTASSPFGPPSDTKPQLLKRRPLRKLLRPVQHLRPLESPNTIRSPPAVTSPQPPPPKKPYMEQKSPEHTSQMGFNPKREPVEPPADEESGDPLMDEQMEMSSVMDSSAGRITPSQMSTIWKPDLSRNANDTSSPGTLQCILGKRGNPRLLVDGHVFFKKSTYKGKSFWYCKSSRTSYKCPAVAWTLHGNIVKWPTSHTHPVIPDIFNPEEDTEVPIDQMQEVLMQSSYNG